MTIVKDPYKGRPPGPVTVPVRQGVFRLPDGRYAQVVDDGPPPTMPPTREEPKGEARQVATMQPYWLNMTVPFTSTAGEQKQGATLTENFDLTVHGAWSNLAAARLRLKTTGVDMPWSTEQVPILSLVGNTNQTHPLLYYRRPWLLRAQTTIQGDFTNDGTEAAGRIAFLCERSDKGQIVTVKDSREYRLLVSLGLSGGATGTGQGTSTQIEYPLLIWGALSTSTGASIRIFDTQESYAWSAQQLPVGAFAGIVNNNVEPIMLYPKPYFLPARASIRVEWTNTANESGKFITFICERILG